MRRLFLFLLFASIAWADGFQSTTFTTTGTGGVLNEIGSGIAFHKLTWTVSGTVSSCTVVVDSSADGVSFNNGDVVSTQTCTSNGNVTSASFVANYTRVRVVTFVGTGTVTVAYNLYVNSPSSGGVADPGSNGLVKRTALNVLAHAAASDVVAGFTGTPDGTKFLRDDGTLVTAGASFPLTSPTTNPAASGSLRLADNTDKICWRNAANSADICLYLDSSNVWQFAGNMVLTGTLTTGSGSGVGFDDYTSGTLTVGGAGVVRVGANSNLASTSENTGTVVPLQVGAVYANAGATGTLANGLVCNSAGTAISCATSTTTGVLGVAVSGAGTTGSVILRASGQLTCVFENTAVVGNWFIPGTGTRGNCRDSGTAGSSAAPTGAYGLALSAGSGSQTILFLGSQGGAGSASVGTNTIQKSNGSGGFSSSAATDDGSTFSITDVVSTSQTYSIGNGTTGIINEAGGGDLALRINGGNQFFLGADQSGTNVAGHNSTVQCGVGTGNTVPCQFNVLAPALGTGSGTTQHTEVVREGYGWSKSLTNNTVTTVSNVTDASNTSAAIIVHYAIEIFDATNVQYEVGLVMCAINNKGGVFSQNTCTKSGNIQGVTSGTLTVTWTITGANPALLQINSNSSLTPTVNRVTYNIENLTQQAVAIQ